MKTIKNFTLFLLFSFTIVACTPVSLEENLNTDSKASITEQQDPVITTPPPSDNNQQSHTGDQEDQEEDHI